MAPPLRYSGRTKGITLSQVGAFEDFSSVKRLREIGVILCFQSLEFLAFACFHVNS